jgi:hypothetical protein
MLGADSHCELPLHIVFEIAEARGDLLGHRELLVADEPVKTTILDQTGLDEVHRR